MVVVVTEVVEDLLVGFDFLGLSPAIPTRTEGAMFPIYNWCFCVMIGDEMKMK